MWDETYLETCCRSALHRLVLSGLVGRPTGLKDGSCLLRLEKRGLASSRADGRFEVTPLGRERHVNEIGPIALSKPPSRVGVDRQRPP
jgi:hypothetical protein